MCRLKRKLQLCLHVLHLGNINSTMAHKCIGDTDAPTCLMLYLQVHKTAEYMAPYALAAGFGDVAAPFQEHSQPPSATDSSLSQGTAAGACAAPIQLPVAAGTPLGATAAAAGTAETTCLPAGAAVAAEQAAVAAQRIIAAPLGREALSRLHFAASVHPSLEGFTYSQPTITRLGSLGDIGDGAADGCESGAARWLVRVHVFAHHSLLEKDVMTPAVSACL